MLFGAMLCAAGMRAQTVSDCVVVETTQGERMEYLLSDVPRITHSDDVVTLATVGETVELQSATIAKIYLSASTVHSAVQGVKRADGTISWRGALVLLSGFRPGEHATLCSADGKVVWQRTIGGDGRLTVSLAGHPAGIYIIKTNHQSVKIVRQ